MQIIFLTQAAMSHAKTQRKLLERDSALPPFAPLRETSSRKRTSCKSREKLRIHHILNDRAGYRLRNTLTYDPGIGASVQ